MLQIFSNRMCVLGDIRYFIRDAQKQNQCITKDMALECLELLSRSFDWFFDSSESASRIFSKKRYVTFLHGSKSHISLAEDLNILQPMIETSNKISEMQTKVVEMYRKLPDGNKIMLLEELVEKKVERYPKPYRSHLGKYHEPLNISRFINVFRQFEGISHRYSSFGYDHHHLSSFHGINENRMFTIIEFQKRFTKRRFNYQKTITDSHQLAHIIQNNYKDWGIAGAKVGHFSLLKHETNDPTIDDIHFGHYVILYHQTKAERQVYAERKTNRDPCLPIPITVNINNTLANQQIQKKSFLTKIKISLLSLVLKIKNFFMKLLKKIAPKNVVNA